MAYAVDEMASEANTARAVGLPRRCSPSRWDSSGRPTMTRLTVEYMLTAGTVVGQMPAAEGDS